MEITAQQIIGPAGPGEDGIWMLADKLFSGTVTHVFGIFSHTILKAEQKSQPMGSYRCKEIILKVNPDQILVNEYLEGRSGTYPPDCFYYRSTSGNTVVEQKVMKDEFPGNFIEALNYYSGSTTDPHISPVPDPVFYEEDDAYGTIGYFGFIKYADTYPGIYVFETTDVIASEEADVKHSPIEDVTDVRDLIEGYDEKLNNDDYRQKRLEMHGRLIISGSSSSIETNFQYTFKVILVNEDGEKPQPFDDMDETDSLYQAIYLYNKINIRTKPE